MYAKDYDECLHKLNQWETGAAPQGVCLIEKPDEPARSRHCEGSEPAWMPLGGDSSWEGAGER